MDLLRAHWLSAYAKLSEKLFFNNPLIRRTYFTYTCIRGLEMLVL